jgi:hypothetical protein
MTNMIQLWNKRDKYCMLNEGYDEIRCSHKKIITYFKNKDEENDFII